MRKIVKIPAQLLPVFYYLFLATPLLYISSSPLLTRSIRLVALVSILATAVTFPAIGKSFVRNIKTLSMPLKIILGVLLSAMLLSSVRSLPDTANTLVGSSPEYLGLLTWLLFISLGVLFSGVAIKLLFTLPTLIIGSSILMASLVFDEFYIKHGLRVAGVFFQPTTMAMFACVLLVPSIYHLLSTERRVKAIAAVTTLLCVITVLLSQSRVGYVSLLIVLAVMTFRTIPRSVKTSVGLISLLLLIVTIPLLHLDFFSRFAADSVQRGVAYRSDIYITAGKDVLTHNFLLGNGPSSLPVAINNQNAVPEEIAKSLDSGYSFNSAHDLYFDVAYYFGVMAAIALAILTFIAFYRTIRSGHYLAVEAVLVGLVLLFNALLNIPSLELTGLFFVVIFDMLTISSPKTTGKTVARSKLSK